MADDISPFGMAERLCPHERAERDDLPAASAGSGDGVLGKRLAYPLPSVKIWNLGVINDDQSW